MVTPTIPTQWQLRKGTLLSAMFREKYRQLAHYSTALFPKLGVLQRTCLMEGWKCLVCMYNFSLEKYLYNAISISVVRVRRVCTLNEFEVITKYWRKLIWRELNLVVSLPISKLPNSILGQIFWLIPCWHVLCTCTIKESSCQYSILTNVEAAKWSTSA